MAGTAPEVPDAGAVWSAEGVAPADIEEALRHLLQEQHARDGAHAPARVLNLVVVVVSLAHVIGHPVVVGDWTAALTGKYSDPLVMVGVALLVFPKLALGLSGFETGVAVMPLVRGASSDTE